MSNEEKNNKRYIAKIKSCEGKYGKYQKIMLDNPDAKKDDGQPDPYNQGALLWIDRKTGQQYQVRQISIKGVSDRAKESGFVASLCIDLENSYETKLLKK